MTIKLAVLKSGEDVVADVQEMLVKDSDGDDKTVGYFFRYPCSVKLFTSDDEDGGDEVASTPFKLRLTPWMPLSKKQLIPVVADWVITITEPIDQLKEMYESGIKSNGNQEPQVTSVGEQSDDSESD